MSLFIPRTFPEIVGDMISRLTSSTPLTDVNFGSVFTTMLEAAAQEDDEQYFSMLEIIRGYSLDTTTGIDLDNRAFEYGLTRLGAQTASTTVTIGDSAVVKVSTGVYSGLPGAVAGSTSINADSDTGFTTSGSIVIGRGTPNAETVPYTSITNNGNYFTFNLGAALAFDHGTDETIVLSQGGNRAIVAGTVVIVPASDLSEQVSFTLDDNATILDGESEVTGVVVTAAVAGTVANVPIGAISQFDSLPFATATVTNPERVTNGRDDETDQELRDRIKDHIQSLSRGTGKSIITGITGLVSNTDNRRVVSASLIEPTIPADVVKLFIDDGTGYIPTFASIGLEEVVASATGGEKFLDANNIPIAKAFVETQNSEPYALSGGEELFVEVGGRVETITFQSTDFSSPGAATAQEVLTKLNASAALFEARISSAGLKVRIFSRTNEDEQIQVTGGSANAALNFPTDLKYTTKLYLERSNGIRLLSKDGITASLESGASAAYDLLNFDHNFALVVDGKEIQYAHLKVFEFANPNAILASEMAAKLNEQLSGAVASTSSNNTRVTLTSNIERDADSMLRIVENFSSVQLYNGAFTDITADAQSGASDQTLFAADGDFLYVGHADVKFESIFVAIDTPASASMGFIAEFWDGSAWQSFGLYDGTDGFTQDGIMWFKLPPSWTVNAVNSVSAYWVRIQRDQPVLVTPPIESRIKVCSGNEILEFTETERVGADRDYVINRFIGQIELVSSPLQAGDRVTLGSTNTRAFVVSNTGPYGLFGGETLDIEIDGVPQTVTFQVGDFFAPGTAQAGEVVNRLSAELFGAVSETIESGTKVKITSNKWQGGTVEITGGTALSVLQFTPTFAEALVPHVPSVESGSAEPYVFSPDQSIVMILDQNATNNLTVPLFRAGTTEAGTSATQIVDTTLQATFPLAADLADFEVYITSGAESGERRAISSYSPGTGTLTLASALGGSPGVGETYQILPVDAETVVKLWNNTKITLLSIDAEITASSGGSKVQVASLESGEAAGVEIAGGSGNAVLNFPTAGEIGVDGYRYWTGLLQLVQWTVDGKEDDPDTYEGIRAAGVQVEVLEPVTKPVRIEVDVTTREGISVSSISNDVKSAISAYVNTLPVGGDVILSEVTVAVKAVAGVFDVSITTPTSNIAVADNELARIADGQIIVG